MSNGNGWMPLYIGDYLGDTMELDGAQHGAYLLLLMYYWRNGPLPIDDAKLAQIARTDIRIWKKTVGPMVKAFFTERGGRLHQKRADIELAKAAECHDRALEKRQADNDRLKAWRARQGGNGSHHPPDETRFTGVSPPVSERVAKRSGNVDETRRTVHTDTDLDSTEKKEVLNKSPLSSSFLGSSRARERPPADELVTVPSEVGVEQPKLGTVRAEVVSMHVRRVAKAMEMRIPYGEVRSVEAQLDALKAQPQAVGADETMGLKWQPHDPVRTPAEQYAALIGCSLAEAEAKLRCVA